MELTNATPLVASERQLRSLIAEGQFPRGERLPTEAILADHAGVSRFTVHRALERLASDGLITRAGKRGWTVTGASSGVLARTVAVLGGDLDLATLRWRGTQAQHLLVYAGAQEALQAQGRDCLAMPVDRVRTEGIESQRAAGLRALLVLLDCSDDDALREWLAAQAASGCAVVMHDDRPPPPGCHAITSDHAAGGALLVEALHARGFRRPLRLYETTPGPPRRSAWAQQRNAGYEEACRRLGIASRPVQQILVPNRTFGNDTIETFEIKVRLAEHLLRPLFAAEDPPDALLGIADRNLFYLAAALRRLGLEPNRDVALVGYDNTWQWCAEMRWEPTAPLLTIDKCEAAIGARMAELLSDPPNDSSRELITPHLIEV